MLRHIAAICASSRSHDLCEQVIILRGGEKKKRKKLSSVSRIDGKRRKVLFADNADPSMGAADVMQTASANRHPQTISRTQSAVWI